MSQPTLREDRGLIGFVHRVLIAALVLILLLFLWQTMHALLLAFAGVLFAILLRAPVNWINAKSGLSERTALLIVVVALFLLVAILGVISVPRVSQQLRELQTALPNSVAALEEWLSQYTGGDWIWEYLPTYESLRGERGRQLFWQATGMAYSTMQTFFGLLVVLFITLYVAADPMLYTNGLLRLLPLGLRPRGAEVLGAVGHTLRWWLLGTLLRMLAVGLMTFVGLWLIGVPLALTLALIALVLDFVPYFGPIVAAVPAVLLAFLGGPTQGLYVIVLYTVVQQVEGLIISPLIYERTVYLPPVLTILAQVLLYLVLGTLGVVLATPLMAVAVVLVKILYVEEVLGDEIKTPEEDMEPEEVPPVPEPKDKTEEGE